MRPQEFYLILETRRPRRPDEYKGSLSERELAQLYKQLPKKDD